MKDIRWEGRHTAVSSAVGVGVGAATGPPEAGALALGFGVLMDVDHLYDFYRWYVKGRSNRFYILFHAWKYSVAGLVVLAAVFFHPLLLATVAAHFATWRLTTSTTGCQGSLTSSHTASPKGSTPPT